MPHEPKSLVPALEASLEAVKRRSGPYYARHSDTSRAAADSVVDTIGDRQAQVYGALIVLGPSRGERIAEYLSTQTYRILPRLTELAELGRVHDTGRREPNKSGRNATVWAAVQVAGNTTEQPVSDAAGQFGMFHARNDCPASGTNPSHFTD